MLRVEKFRGLAWLQVATQVALVIWNEASSTQTSAALISAMMQVKTTDAGSAFCILMVHFAHGWGAVDQACINEAELTMPGP